MVEEIQFELDIGEVFKLEPWLGRKLAFIDRTKLSGAVDGLLWNLWELMILAEVTEHDLVVEIIEGQVESPELDEDVAGGI